MNNNLKICRVCGYEFDNFYPWGEDGISPSFSYCPCCFTEFGYDDAELKMIKQQRNSWIEKGAIWHEPDKKPQDWVLEQQLKNIPTEYQ